MNVYEAIQTRHSIRKYTYEPIPKEKIEKIVSEAQLAPSAGNKQPWRFIIVQDRDKIKKIAEIANKQTWIADAGAVVIAMAVDKKSPEVYERWAERDVMTAVEHMVLTAWEMGYGTCWIGAFNQGDIKEFLGIPENMTVINLLPIGKPDQSPTRRPRKPIDEMFYGEEYGKPLKI